MNKINNSFSQLKSVEVEFSLKDTASWLLCYPKAICFKAEGESGSEKLVKEIKIKVGLEELSFLVVVLSLEMIFHQSYVHQAGGSAHILIHQRWRLSKDSEKTLTLDRREGNLLFIDPTQGKFA